MAGVVSHCGLYYYLYVYHSGKESGSFLRSLKKLKMSKASDESKIEVLKNINKKFTVV